MTMTADLVVTPVHLGPTWELDPDWDGPRDPQGYILPKRTLGWQALRWVEDNLLDESATPLEQVPFKPTDEQTRLVLWWYAVDEHGFFVYRDGVIQRLKGWGKDPLAAVLAAVEFVGPCRFSHWAENDIPELELFKGDPVAKSHPRAWVQVAAVSKDQTKNTMKVFNGLFSAHVMAEHSINLGKEIIYGHHGQTVIEAVTSSPSTLEGGRATFVIRNETHHWRSNNDGHDMADVIERNATKSKDGSARALSITNAYEPSQDSVAQHQREAWEAEHAGLAIDTGILYDSLEAPEEATLRPPRKDGEPEATEDEVREHLAAIIRGVRGDSSWLNIDRIVNSILDTKNPPSRSRRFWFNQVKAAEDAWLDPAAIAAAASPFAMANRKGEVDQLRAGWLVMPDEPVAMFFDGSKSDDATALVGVRISDGYVFTIGVWSKPPGDRGKNWLVPRHEVDNRVEEAFGRFKIVAFWADPSHAIDDEDSTRYWDGLIDDWMRRFKDRLEVWPTKTGHNAHAIMFDMTSPERQKLFVAEAERFTSELETKDDIERFAPQWQHDGHPALVQHMKHAIRYPMRFGVSLMKVNRESAKKIDLAVAAVGARMVRRIYLNRLETETPVDREVWAL